MVEVEKLYEDGNNCVFNVDLVVFIFFQISQDFGQFIQKGFSDVLTIFNLRLMQITIW